jgi:hypothetical protein
MNKLYIIALVMAISGICLAEQISVNIDRMAVLAPNPDSLITQNTLVAIHFTLPELSDSVKIIYAEIVVPLDFYSVASMGDSVLELQAYPIIHDWTPQSSWNNPWSAQSSDLDMLTSFGYTIKMSNRNSSRVYLDVTKFIKEIVCGDKQNFGLMLFPNNFGDRAFQLPPMIVQQIRNSAILRITYR